VVFICAFCQRSELFLGLSLAMQLLTQNVMMFSFTWRKSHSTAL